MNNLINFILDEKTTINDLCLYFNTFDMKQISYNISSIADNIISGYNSEIAIKLYEKSYLLYDKNSNAAKGLFVKKLMENNLQDAISILIRSYDQDEYNLDKDLMYYMFLVSELTELPKIYGKEVKKRARYDNISIKGDIINKDLLNQIRSAALDKKFAYALKCLKRYILNDRKLLNIDIYTERYLLGMAADKKALDKKNILNLVQEKKYNELLDYLYHKRYSLTKKEKLLRYLAITYLNIDETREIPEINEEGVDNLPDAIDNNNFIESFRMCSVFNDDHSIEFSESPFIIILSDIIFKINSIQKKNISDINDTTTLYTLFVVNLINNKTDESVFALKKYLKLLNKEDYYELILSIIKISMVEKDVYYDKTINFINNIDRIDLNKEIWNDLHKFNLYKSIKNVEMMEAYYYVITSLNKFCNVIKTDLLLESIWKIKKEKENIIQKDDYIEENNINSVQSHVMENYKYLLENKGMVILDCVSYEERKEAIRIAKDLPNISVFMIRDGQNKRVVLKYSNRELKDLSDLIFLAKEAYNNHEYLDHIKYSLKIISSANSVRAVTCIKLGFSYLKTENYQEALKYFTIGNSLLNRVDRITKYDEIIEELKLRCDYEKCKNNKNKVLTLEKK